MENSQEYVTREEFEDLVALVKKNTDITKKTYSNTKKIQKSLMISRIAGIIKLVIIILPFILAYIYVLPYISDKIKMINDFTESLPFYLNAGSNQSN